MNPMFKVFQFSPTSIFGRKDNGQVQASLEQTSLEQTSLEQASIESAGKLAGNTNIADSNSSGSNIHIQTRTETPTNQEVAEAPLEQIQIWDETLTPELEGSEESEEYEESEDSEQSHPDSLPNVWVYDRHVYDLSDFINKHPGGEFFIGRMKNRDITTIVNIFHPNPEKVKKMLAQYALGREAVPEDVHPKYSAPEFLFREGFDGWRDTPNFDFDNKDQLLHKIKSRLNTDEMTAKVKRADFWFDVVSVILGIAYFLVQILRLEFTQYMPVYIFVPLMVMLRISLAGTGHYLIHRPQVGWNKFIEQIFDLNYVPMAFVVTDGHDLMHHPFTQSEVDIKRNVFTAMLELPRLYRIPIHTLHKIAHVLTGMLIRSFELCMLGFKFGVKDMYGSWQRSLPHYIGLFAMRILLLGELILFALHGDLWAWFAQFAITLWISTFMIVASHDFEDMEKDDDIRLSGDWGIFQIKNSYDLTMIGNKYIDCFLSAGLSPHRVHHVLPYQKKRLRQYY